MAAPQTSEDIFPDRSKPYCDACDRTEKNCVCGKNAATKLVSRTAKNAVEGNMADQKREALREKIAARRAERKAELGTKYARLRQVAAEEPKEVDAALGELAEAFGAMADGLNNLRDNLDLIQAPKTAKLAVRIAAARKYAKAFKQAAEETPEVVADALNEIYNSLDEIAAGVENLAEHIGVEINSTPTMDAFADEGQAELDEAEEEGESVHEQIEEEAAGEEEPEHVEEEEEENKEASGSDNFVMNNEAEEVKEASGADNFLMDNSDKKVEHMEIPEAQGKAASVDGHEEAIQLAQELIENGDDIAHDVAAEHGMMFDNVKHMRWFVEAVAEEVEGMTSDEIGGAQEQDVVAPDAQAVAAV
jgi:hypothetical protein